MRHLTLLTFFSLPAISLAADLNGSTLNLLWGLPFAMILLSIALGPLFFSYIWHHHFGKITAFWTLSFLIPFSLIFGAEAGIRTVVHALIEEYIPFILLLLALYTISGGIFVGGNLRGTPKLNTSLLAVGTALASIMGTTGAAMLIIRPLLKANQTRTPPCAYCHLLYFPCSQYRRRPDSARRSPAVPRFPKRRRFHVDGQAYACPGPN